MRKLSDSPRAIRERLALALAERDHRAAGDRLSRYHPYPKQRDFHACGAHARERLMMASNQSGKTIAGGAEMAMHLTGRYPDDWAGLRFERPIRALAGSKTTELTRAGVQRVLLGPPEDRSAWGTGMIPRDAIADTSLRRGVPDAVDTIVVRHVSGRNSSISLKSYDQGREKWQADTVDLVWLDEEPALDIYTEALTRTNATGGSVYLTFTPLLGMSQVVARFLLDDSSPDRAVISMTIDDAAHFSAEQRAQIIASYPEHEREARVSGIPSMGSGRVFPVPEESILCEPFEIPAYWPQVAALDFGWDHPTAAVALAWNRDTDSVFVTRAYRVREQTPAIHVAALRPWGDWLPWAWPHDGLQHDKGSGEQLAEMYRTHGLDMLPERAMFPDGSNGVEAGLQDMLERMQSGRFHVFRHLAEWMEEFRLYHRKEGRVVKERDDLISATRYGVMSLRFARTKPSIRATARTQTNWRTA